MKAAAADAAVAVSAAISDTIDIHHRRPAIAPYAAPNPITVAVTGTPTVVDDVCVTASGYAFTGAAAKKSGPGC